MPYLPSPYSFKHDFRIRNKYECTKKLQIKEKGGLFSHKLRVIIFKFVFFLHYIQTKKKR